jgi:hypothetical protein
MIVPTSCHVSGGGVSVAQAPIEMPSFNITDVQISQFGVEMLVGQLGLPEGDDDDDTVWTMPPGPVTYPYDAIGFIEDDI